MNEHKLNRMIIESADRFDKILIKALDQIKILIHKKSLSKDSIDTFKFLLYQQNILLDTASQHLKNLKDIAETNGWRGWINRKIASNLMSNIRQRCFLFDQGIHIIKNKPVSIAEQKCTK